jgi:hypothetical protein
VALLILMLSRNAQTEMGMIDMTNSVAPGNGSFKSLSATTSAMVTTSIKKRTKAPIMLMHQAIRSIILSIILSIMIVVLLQFSGSRH